MVNSSIYCFINIYTGFGQTLIYMCTTDQRKSFFRRLFVSKFLFNFGLERPSFHPETTIISRHQEKDAVKVPSKKRWDICLKF